MSEATEVQPTVMDNQDWSNRWDARAIGFHKDYINPMLEKHVDLMVNGRANLRILVPLCGKSLDMKWLLDKGHTVIGVEVVKKAIEEFFEEQKIAFSSAPAPALEGTLYQSDDKKVQIYCCDFFKISPATVGHVNAIWDRGSMVAINVSDRARYAGILQSVMSPDCRYLLSALQYDPTKYGGPPHHLPDEDVLEAFEKANNVKELNSHDVLEPGQRTRWGIDWLTEKAFLITPKK